jgi:uncharacterized protein YacL
MPNERWWVKLLFVVVFLGVATAIFFASAPLAEWVKSSKSDLVRTFAVQAVAALPFMLLIFAMEERLIWRLVRQDIFSTIHPISLGAYVGYVVHFALG